MPASEDFGASRNAVGKARARGMFQQGVSGGFREFPTGFRQDGGIRAVLLQLLEIVAKKASDGLLRWVSGISGISGGHFVSSMWAAPPWLRQQNCGQMPRSHSLRLAERATSGANHEAMLLRTEQM